jgi:hypothetical protein
VDYPLTQELSVGALSSIGPLICGGFLYTNDCYHLEDGLWKIASPLNEAKFGSAICPSFLKDDFQYIITGGYKSSRASVTTTEVLTEDGWITSLPALPEAAESHCLVKVNSTTILAIISQNTYFMSNNDQIWIPGPKLNLGRYVAGCGMIQRNSSSYEKSVIVVGGGYWSSAEILDDGASQWRNGPSLPLEIGFAQLVQDDLGGVVLVGGQTKNGTFLDTLFRLADVGDEAQWKQLPQRLKLARHSHTAMLIPDGYVNCTLK